MEGVVQLVQLTATNTDFNQLCQMLLQYLKVVYKTFEIFFFYFADCWEYTKVINIDQNSFWTIHQYPV